MHPSETPMAWITPAGRTIGCAYGWHLQALIDELDEDSLDSVKDLEQKAERLGWAKFTYDTISGSLRLFCAKAVTQAQLDALFDWSVKHGFDYSAIHIEAEKEG